MKFLIAFLIVLVATGFWLTYDNVSAMKDKEQETVKVLKDTVKNLESQLQNEITKNQSQANSFAKNDEINNLKTKISEMELKQSSLDELKKQISEMDEKLKKKEELNACDQCAVEKCIAAQKKKMEPAPVRKVVHKTYKKPECPNKLQVAQCIDAKMKEWRASCKITTTPEKVKSSFISSEKEVNKYVKKENETIIVSLEPSRTQVPDLEICLKSKEEISKDCNKKYCSGY